MTDIPSIARKYDELEAANKQLMDNLAMLDEKELRYKAKPEVWSIIQVLNHVRGTEQGTLTYVGKKIKYGGLKPLNWSTGIRAWMMKRINNSSVRFKMPSVLAQPSEEGTLESITEEWAALHQQWRSFINEFPPEALNKAVFRHPIFGRMSLYQAMESMISHQNHHMKQIDRIRKSFKLVK